MNLSEFSDKLEKKLSNFFKLDTDDNLENKLISKLTKEILSFMRKFIDEFKDEHDIDRVTDDIIDESLELFEIDFDKKFRNTIEDFSPDNIDTNKIINFIDDISRTSAKFIFNILS